MKFITTAEIVETKHNSLVFLYRCIDTRNSVPGIHVYEFLRVLYIEDIYFISALRLMIDHSYPLNSVHNILDNVRFIASSNPLLSANSYN